MVRFLLSLMLLLAMAATVVACPCTGDDSPCKCDPAAHECKGECGKTLAPPEPSDLTSDDGFGVNYTKERVLELPRDSNRLFVTVFGNPKDAKYQDVKQWFKDVPELDSIRRQTHFNAIDTTSPDFKSKYAKTVPAAPLIRVQTATGGVVYQVSGQNLPMSGEALSKSMNTKLFNCWRKRHQEEEKVEPIDEDEGWDDDESFPDTDPVTPDDEISPMVVLVLSALAGFMLMATLTLIKNVQAKRRMGQV